MIALMLTLALLGGDPFILLAEEEDGKLELDPGSVAINGGIVRATAHLTPGQNRGYAVSQADVRVDCPSSTITWLAVRTYDETGAELQSVEIPAELQKAEPLYRETPYAGLHARYCSGALPPPPPPLPPPAAVPRS